jgi:hypothetical protein
MTILLFVYVGSSLILAGISLPLIAERIKPNPWYGFRVSQTLEDPRVWYATNKYFARRLLVVAIVDAITAIGLYFIPQFSVDAYALVCLGVFVLVSSFAIGQSWRYMKNISS